MKIIIKHGSIVKLFANELNYDNIVKFIETDVLKQKKNFSLSFQDPQGDQVSIISQSDIDILKEIYPEKDYVKVVLEEEINLSKVQSVQKEESKVSEEQITQQKKQCSTEQLQKKWSHCKKKKQEHWKKWGHCGGYKKAQHLKNSDKSEEEQKRSPHKKQWKKQCGENMGPIHHLIKETITQIVDERIKALTPCLKNQVQCQEFKFDEIDNKELIHEGIECQGCKISPLVGIRYKCPQCINFNLCSICESKIDHQHDLLKIKIVRVEEQPQYGGIGKIMKMICGWKHFMKGQHPHHHHRHSHSHSREDNHHKSRSKQHWKPFKNMNKDLPFPGKCTRLSKIFGNQPQFYKQFVLEHKDIRPKDIVTVYAQKNGFDMEEVTKARTQRKIAKLSAFFNKSPEKYQKFVEQNSSLNFRELIRLLKERKLQDYDGSNFKQMAENMPQVEKQFLKNVCLKKTSSKQEFTQVDKKEQVEEVKAQGKEKGIQMRQKGKILIEMKQLFGAQNSKQMFKFIEKNFSKGKQSIIDGWIANISE